MSDARFNCLIDLVLVCGADEYSGLKVRKPTPRLKKRSTAVPPRPASSSTTTTLTEHLNRSGTLNGVPRGERSKQDQAHERILAPNNGSRAQVLQVFSASHASYPNRPDSKQLSRYPNSLEEEGVLEAQRDCSSIFEESQSDDEENYQQAIRRKTLHHQLARQLSLHPSLIEQDNGKRGRSPSFERESSYAWKKHHGGRRATDAAKPSPKLYRRNQPNAPHSAEAVVSSSRPAPNIQTTMISTRNAAMPLNAEQIGALCQLSFPEGLKCFEEKPEESLTCYVLTDLSGERFYAVTLTFYQSFTVDLSADSDSNEQVYHLMPIQTGRRSDGLDPVIYVPTCCVLVSMYPYFNTLQKCLSDLHMAIRYDLQHLDDHVKRFASTMTNIPVPPSGNLALSFRVSQGHSPVIIRPALHPRKSVIDLNMSTLFTILPTSVICAVISAVLIEERVAFVSSNYALLTIVQEAIMHIIYPFRWQSIYVPVLSEAMVGYVESPGFYIMGCHARHLEEVQAVEGVILVNLDEGTVLSSPPATIPVATIANFCREISNIDMNFDLHAVGKVLTDVEAARQEFMNKVNKEIFSVSLNLMVELFGDVLQHIRMDIKFFNQPEYIASKSENDRPFYEAVLRTAMFKSFLQDLLISDGKEPTVWQVKATEKMTVSQKRRSMRSHSGAFSFGKYKSTTMEVFQLPEMDRVGDFMCDAALNIDAFHNVTDSSQKASCLHILGCLHLQRNLLQQALKTFGELYALNSACFPRQAIIDLLSALDDPADIIESLTPDCQKLYKDLLVHCGKKTRTAEVKIDLEHLPSQVVSRTEFLKYADRLDLATDMDTMDRLFNALTLGEIAEVEPEYVKEFYECWKDNEAKCSDIESQLNEHLSNVEPLLKVSSLVRTDLGTGHMVLTHRQLLFLMDGAQHDPVTMVTRLSNISNVEEVTVKAIFSANLAAVRIHYSQDSGSMKTFTMNFKEDCQLWRYMMQEVVGGRLIAMETKEQFINQQAASNALLLDALVQSASSTLRLYHSKDLSKALDLLACYSKEETRTKLATDSQVTKDTLIFRINPNADDVNPCSVDSILYVPGSSTTNTSDGLNSPVHGKTTPTVWCGMSGGKIRIFDASTWRLLPLHIQADDRHTPAMCPSHCSVICLEYAQGHVWAGSMDKRIYIIENDLQRLPYTTLDEHNDFVVDLKSLSDDSTMFSACVIGTIISWDIASRTVLQTFTINTATLKSIQIVSMDEIWCCCRDKLVRMNSSGCTMSTLQHIDERDKLVYFDCFCVIGDDVWAGCAELGRLIVWNKVTEERHPGSLPLDTRGVSQMTSIGDALYIGCKASHGSRDEEYSNEKTKMYLANSRTYQIMSELAGHSDSIRSMYPVQQKYILTGSGSAEGKVVIWKHDASSLEHERREQI